MDHPQIQKMKVNVHGMTCASCEIMIERSWKKIPGIRHVSVNHANGKAEILCSSKPPIAELQQAIQEHGYTVSEHQEATPPPEPIHHRATKRDYAEIGAAFLVILGLYLLLKQLDLLPSGFGVKDNMSYGFVFVIGLVAAVSTCIAVTGGLLLAIAGKYNERNPDLSGVQRFRPHVYFNAGRVVSYTLLGGVIGALGSVITLSPRASGYLTIVVSIIMIILGFQILKVFPWMKRFQPKMPKFLAHKIHDWSASDRKAAPFFLGASTFFLPCGFTQALQLYVLSKGSFTVGAFTMLAFSLGTLPALLSLSAISSFSKGRFQRYFLRFVGVLVIILGFTNIQSGFALTGTSLDFGGEEKQAAVVQRQQDPNVKLIDGKQVVAMTVRGLQYSPSQFTVEQNVPVEWRIDGTQAGGCARVITVPKLGIVQSLKSSGVTTISFTPTKAGKLEFSCSMGMTTRGAAFNIVASSSGNSGTTSGGANQIPIAPCDPRVAECITN
ncbi:MAG: sulfite exporter TauE/SafE family protein [Candidatus Kerfeldbacteria bacterium]|nr:sulfite exporter TauE/SafE family protein [Candidatus Kerfeldbacteria bacterium]